MKRCSDLLLFRGKRGIHAPLNWEKPGAEAAVKAARSCAFIGVKRRALTGAGAEGSSPLSRMLTHPLPSNLILRFCDLIEQLIELLL